MIGKDIRIERIIDRNTGRSVIVPMDHGFSMGQIEGLTDMTKVISDVSDGGANAIVLHKGLVKRGHRKHGRDIGLIIHLSGSTSLNPDPNDKVQVCTVEEAITLGADAVSIHINLGSPNESKMLEIGAKVTKDCARWGMPLLAMVYPRGKGIDSFSPQNVGHAVRVAEELGSDMIKTNYPNDAAAFQKIVKACSVPVFIAGGEKVGDLDSLKIIRDSVNVGGAGVCVGRNSFQREDTTAFVKALCAVVHDNTDPEKALGKKR